MGIINAQMFPELIQIICHVGTEPMDQNQIFT